MIGLWNQCEQHAYKTVHSDYQVDAAGAKLRRQLDDGSFVWTCCDTIVDLYSMALWGRIALDIEQLRVALALDFLRGFPAAKVLGVLVDGVMFTWSSFEAVPDIGLRFPDGSPVFQLKREPACKIPTWPMSDPERSQALGPTECKWRVLTEEDIGKSTGQYQDLAAVARDHGGLMITGFAGTGKTYPVFQLLPALAEMFPGKKIIKMALRHAAAMLLGGHTIAH
jgi:hypothetical protein